MSLRARLIVAFLALALVPTALLTLFTLDRLGRAIELWNTRGVNRALESALETSKTSLARMEAVVIAQSADWARALPPGPLDTARRTAIRAGLRAAGLDFIQLYRRSAERWELVEEVLPEGVLAIEPIDLSAELAAAVDGEHIVHSARGALAGAHRMDAQWALAAGMRVRPDFFAEIDRISEGVSYYHRFAVVRDLSRTYMLLLVGSLVLLLTLVAVGVARSLASSMTRPLRQLEAALEQVAQGDLATRVEPAGAREIRMLGERFNAMTARLAAARQALTEAEREAVWREVARRLAHEFKNILTPMSLAVHRLRRRAALVPEGERPAVEDSLEAIAQSVEDLDRLAEQFSHYARLPEPHFERIDLTELARAAVRLHETGAQRVTVDPGAPRLMVAADRMLLSRAVHNLVLNACEASRPGDRVELQLAAEDGMAVLQVLDKGHGVPAEIRDQLFQPYVSTRRRGSGLGLSLVHDIVTQHHGTVTLANRAGGGACARLTIPLLEEGGRRAADA